MKFEDRVTVLCAQALAADDDAEVRKVLTELRLALHQRIEQLRKGLMVAYTSMIDPEPFQHLRQKAGIVPPVSAPMTQGAGGTTPRTWQRIVQEIAAEKDHGKALRLSQELNSVLQRYAESPQS